MNQHPSIFAGLGDAPTFERGNYMNPGIYDVMIGRAMARDTRESGLATIVELDILTAQFRPQTDPKNLGRVWQPTPQGIQGTWFQGMTDKNVAMPAIKSFVRATLGLKGNDPAIAELDSPIPGTRMSVIENLMLHGTGPENVFQGLFVHLECYMILTAKKKEDFTVYNFTPLNFPAMGLTPPDVAGFIAKGRTPFIPQAPMGGPPPGWGQPAPAWGQPAQPQWGQPPPQGPPAPPWSQTPPQGGTWPQAGPPPGYGQPPAQPPNGGWQPPGPGWGRR